MGMGMVNGDMVNENADWVNVCVCVFFKYSGHLPNKAIDAIRTQGTIKLKK